MANEQELKSRRIRRGTIKSAVTRVSNFVRDFGDGNIFQLKTRLVNLREAFKEFDAVQLQIEILDETAYYNIESTILEKIETATVNEAAAVANATGFTHRYQAMVPVTTMLDCWETLITRFENKRLIIQEHAYAIINLPPLVKNSYQSLRKLVDDFNINLAALTNLGQPTEHWSGLLVPIISQKMDFFTKREWEAQLGPDPPTVETLIVICIARLRNPTLTNQEKNCRQGHFAAETRQSRGRQRIS
jgi:hypothetical protein